jgi:hypothetical protein
METEKESKFCEGTGRLISLFLFLTNGGLTLSKGFLWSNGHVSKLFHPLIFRSN